MTQIPATVLVSTWNDGLFAISGDEQRPELAGLPSRGLAADGRGGRVFLVDFHDEA